MRVGTHDDISVFFVCLFVLMALKDRNLFFHSSRVYYKSGIE
jgi:hypothetical protein